MTTRSGREYSVYVQTMSGTEYTGMDNEEEPGLAPTITGFVIRPSR